MNKPFLSVFESQALMKSLVVSTVRAAVRDVATERRSPTRRLEAAQARRGGSGIGAPRTKVNIASLLRIAAMFAGVLLLALPASADSLWKEDVARPIVADKRAVAVGDILTIVVQETTTTAKDQNTKTSKSSGVDASISSFLYAPTASGLLTKNGKLPAMKFDAKSDFSGGGAINNSEKIVARIAVRVIDVLPNRNLIIEGSKETAFSGEQQTAILRGTVRPEDIAGNNTIYSYNIADASIKFVSKGAITDTQRKGWFTKIWDKLTPF